MTQVMAVRQHLRLTFVIARRLGRARWLLASSLTVVLAAAMVAIWYCILQAQSLTGEQIADNDLGVYGAYAGYGAGGISPGSAAQAALAHRLAPVAGPDAQVALICTDFSASWLSDKSVRFTEMNWESQPFPKKYQLMAGRWPRQAGEIAIVNPSGGDRSKVLSQIEAYGGRVRLSIVGAVDDRYSRSVELLAGPGTWADLSPDLATGNPSLRAYPVVYWDGRQTDRVLAAITDGIRGLDGSDATTVGVAAQVRNSYADRTTVEAHDGKSWIAHSPAGYTIPSVLLPLVAALVVFAMNRRRLAPALAVLTSVGVPRRIAVAGASIAVTGWCLAAAGLGSLIGLLLGHITTRALAGLISVPIPVLPDLVSPLVRAMLVTAAGCLAGAGLLWRLTATRSHQTRPASTRHLRNARHLIAAMTFGVAAVRLRGLSSAAEVMLFAAVVTTGVLLMLPDAIPALLRLLPERDLRARLTKRQLIADAARATTIVAVLTVLLGLSTGFTALLDTMIRTAGAEVYPAVLPGQITITDRSTDVLPAPAGAVAAARTVPAIRDQTPITLQFLMKSADSGRSVDTGPRVHAGDTDGLVMAVKSRTDVERLIGRSLSDSQNNTLRIGGVLLWRGQPTPSISLRVMQGDKPVADPVTVPAERLSIPQTDWNAGRDGVMLTSTAKKHRLPLATGSLMYTDISDSDAIAVRAAVEQAGLDPAMITIHQTPPPPIPPAALYLTAAGLALMTLVVTLSLTRGQVRALRDYLGHLIALGVPLRWVRSIVIRQHFMLLTLATILGLAVGLPPVLLATWLISGFELSIPWGQLTVLLVAVYTSALLATYLSSRRLTARSRLGGR